MNYIKIDDGNGSRGIEALYYQEIKALYIYPTNHREDWKSNFAGWICPKYVKGYGLVNRVWWKEVEWLAKHLKGVSILRGGGWSKGGSQAQYLAFLRPGFQVFSTAGFPAKPLGKLNGELYKKRGDVIPLFSRRRYEEAHTISPWRWPWKAHIFTREEREKITLNKYNSFTKNH